MYPFVFELGSFAFSAFEVTMTAGLVVGAWIGSRRMREEGLAARSAWILLLYAAIGGVAGAKLDFALATALREGLPLAKLLFVRSGMSWYGGLAGATLAGALGCRIHGVPVKAAADCAAVGAAVGQAIGRLGCFLVGDDYGSESDLPWAIRFPMGSPPTPYAVHPTQLYELAWLLAVAALLWRRRRTSPFLFAEYLAAAGLGRFAIEFWRVNPRLALGLSQPQWISLGVVAVAGALWLRQRSRAST